MVNPVGSGQEEQMCMPPQDKDRWIIAYKHPSTSAGPEIEKQTF